MIPWPHLPRFKAKKSLKLTFTKQCFHSHIFPSETSLPLPTTYLNLTHHFGLSSGSPSPRSLPQLLHAMLTSPFSELLVTLTVPQQSLGLFYVTVSLSREAISPRAAVVGCTKMLAQHNLRTKESSPEQSHKMVSFLCCILSLITNRKTQ